MGRHFFLLAICGLMGLSTACAGFRSGRSEEVSVPEPYIHEDQIFSNLSFDVPPLPDSLYTADSSYRILQDARQRMAAALGALDRGDTAAARIVVDDVLGLMVVLSDIADPAVAQERDQLLKSVSTLIDDLQTGGHTAQIRKGEIPEVANERVERQVKWFMQKNRNGIRVAYSRAGRYGDMIRRELAMRGLPPQLQWLPVIESAYHPLAYSWANAAGLWQFIPETGRRYGLSRTGWVDDRMDPYKASQAAAAYLEDLYGMFGDWLLAVAAYNCGEERVLRAVNRAGTRDYWKLKLPHETLDYVPRFLAAVAIIENPERYDMTFPEPMAPYVFEEARIEKSIALADAARVLGVSQDQIKAMNTGIRNGVTPPGGYDLRVPLGMGSALLARLSEIPEARHAVVTGTGSYKVKRGDSLGRIAKKQGTTVPVLKKLNGLKNNNLKIDQALRLPGRAVEEAVVASAQAKPEKTKPVVQNRETVSTTNKHKIRRGDTLASIAGRYGVSLAMLRKANPELKLNRLHVGQTVFIPTGEEAETTVAAATSRLAPTPAAAPIASATPAVARKETVVRTTISHKVRPGDTLGDIAEYYEVSLSSIRKANPRVKPGKLKLGQTVVVPGVKEPELVTVAAPPPPSSGTASTAVSGENPAPIATASSRGPSVHVVQQGDSIWSIARQYGLSVVDVLNLNHLKRGATILPGQILKLAAGAQPLSGKGSSLSTQVRNAQPR
ncbi:MAG: LysM peptidoglycan-binding domain-containing protein [candidate division Zixibacteria bacterium]|nr:LysM peptidoglycan-binding domain-containing protein [candidate division Zixibacteria bacterium]